MAPLTSSSSAHSFSVKELYPANWPASPFHKGEIQVQKQLGCHDHVMSYAPKVVRPFLPAAHRAFFEQQPFLVVAARDQQGRMWATLLAAAAVEASGSKKNNNKTTRMTSSPDPKTLLMDAQPVAGDALEGALLPGTDMGVIGIEFATKRRNRVNGRLVKTSHNKHGNVLEFKVDQSFGNCPQYIKPRQWRRASTNETNTCTCMNDSSRPVPTTTANNNKNRPDHLSEDQMARIRQAETIFLASGYRGDDSDDPRFGNDASHRGGPAGFVRVRNRRTLTIPDFSGNNHYNTIGNLVVDPRIGITFPDYEGGGMIQVTGRARVHLDSQHAATVYPGALRLIEIEIDQVMEVAAGSLPIRWTTDTAEPQERELVVNAKIRESDDVVSFHLRPQDHELQSLWKFSPGQHLPIALAAAAATDDPFQTTASATIERTYSISAGPNWGEYRISVKRQGLASNFLHDKIQVGDTILVQKPAGDFALDLSTQDSSDRPLVLLSNGIGVTPMISMLHHWANSNNNTSDHPRRKVFWIHGARNGKHHSFVSEVEELQRMVANDSFFSSHIAYSQPNVEDEGSYDVKGRLSTAQIAELVPDIANADIYMCGSDAFVADMNDGLVQLEGVSSSQIHYETF